MEWGGFEKGDGCCCVSKSPRWRWGILQRRWRGRSRLNRRRRRSQRWGCWGDDLLPRWPSRCNWKVTISLFYGYIKQKTRWMALERDAVVSGVHVNSRRCAATPVWMTMGEHGYALFGVTIRCLCWLNELSFAPTVCLFHSFTHLYTHHIQHAYTTLQPQSPSTSTHIHSRKNNTDNNKRDILAFRIDPHPTSPHVIARPIPIPNKTKQTTKNRWH